jgi:addiction module RelB/DinJ family antitoxin
MWHNRGMTDIFRVRIERSLVKRATKVAEEIGTTPGEIVRMLFTQLVKRRAIPFDLKADIDDIDVQRRNNILRNLDDSEGW